MPANQVSIGDVDITSLSDGSVRFFVSEFFPSVSSDAWEPYLEQLTPDRKVDMNLGSFLLRSEGKAVLVDTGLGEDSSRFQDAVSGSLLRNMEAGAVRPEDVDMVVSTHLHPDHVGWNLSPDERGARPTFPNARYWVPKKDLEFFGSRARGNAMSHIKDQVTPLEALGMLEVLDGESALTGELTAFPTPGHTPGHISILISSRGERGIIVGDAAHLPLQAHETDWSPRADIDPDQSRATRRSLMTRVDKDGSLLISGHFPAPGFGRIARLEGRRYWQALS